jgi:hypothetical protein
VYAFPIILLISVVGCLAGSLLTPPDDERVLMAFYIKTRPWGFWKPVHDKAVAEHPGLINNSDFKRDMFNVVVGIFWQTAITASPIFLVIKEWGLFAAAMSVVAVCSMILKFNWYDKLKDFPDAVLEK